jgi:hypothetical protein
VQRLLRGHVGLRQVSVAQRGVLAQQAVDDRQAVLADT